MTAIKWSLTIFNNYVRQECIQKRKIEKTERSFISGTKLKPGWSWSTGVEDDETLGPLLVHDPVSAFSASDGVAGSNLVLWMAFTADIDHRVADGAGGVGWGAGLWIHDRWVSYKTSIGECDSYGRFAKHKETKSYQPSLHSGPIWPLQSTIP